MGQWRNKKLTTQEVTKLDNTQRDVFVDNRQRQLLARSAVELVMMVRKMPGGRDLIAKKMQQIHAERKQHAQVST